VGDPNRLNDTLSLGFVVNAPVDVSVEEISAPNGQYTRNDSVVPSVTIKNGGAEVVTALDVWMLLGVGNMRKLAISKRERGLEAGAPRVVDFDAYRLADTGSWTAKCSVVCVGDPNTTNNMVTSEFRVQQYAIDMRPVSLPAVQDTYQYRDRVTPVATWVNNGSTTITRFSATIILTYEGAPNPEYVHDSIWTGSLLPDQSVELAFPMATLTPAGTWQMRCSTFCAGESAGAQANNTLSKDLTVLRVPSLSLAVPGPDSVVEPESAGIRLQWRAEGTTASWPWKYRVELKRDTGDTWPAFYADTNKQFVVLWDSLSAQDATGRYWWRAGVMTFDSVFWSNGGYRSFWLDTIAGGRAKAVADHSFFCYPNPVEPGGSTTFRFIARQAITSAVVKVYNSAEELVGSIPFTGAGGSALSSNRVHRAEWNTGKAIKDDPLAQGVYFAVLETQTGEWDEADIKQEHTRVAIWRRK
jgi:hypothetical protein